MKQPKCRLCGAEHGLREPHTFGSVAAKIDQQLNVASATMLEAMKPLREQSAIAIEAMTALRPGPIPKSAKIDRKEYLKLKARERRARQKAAKK